MLFQRTNDSDQAYATEPNRRAVPSTISVSIVWALSGEPFASVTCETTGRVSSLQRAVASLTGEAGPWRLLLGSSVLKLHETPFSAGVVDGSTLRLIRSRPPCLVTASNDGTAKLWSSISGECLRTLEGHEAGLEGAALSQDGDLVATASLDGTAKVWSSTSGDCLRTLDGHGDALTSVAFSPIGELVVTTSHDWTAKLWSSTSGKCLRTLEGHDGPLWHAAFSPDGELVATASNDCTARLWSSTSEKCLILEGHGWEVMSAAFSPDGELVVTGSEDGTAKLWSSTSGYCLRTLEVHAGTLWSIPGTSRWFTFGTLSAVFSPDGALLATASDDRTAKLWSSTSGECLRSLAGHGKEVFGVAFSVDGELVVTASGDNTARLWSTTSWDCLWTLEGHSRRVMSAAFPL